MNDMFAPVTNAQAAACTSEAAHGPRKPITLDFLVKGTPWFKLQEGSQWLRFINTFGNPWARLETTYKLNSQQEICQWVATPEKDPVLTARIALYQDPRTKHLMRSKTEDGNVLAARHELGIDKAGLGFGEQSCAFLIASTVDEGNQLGDFKVLRVVTARPPGKKDAEKPRPGWGDGLLRLPTLLNDDPTMCETLESGEKYKYGAVYDIERGRLIQADATNVGTMSVSVSWLASENTLPLGKFHPGGFTPEPQYADILSRAPNLKTAIYHATYDEQLSALERYLPGIMWEVAHAAIRAREGRRAPVQGAAIPQSPQPAKAQPSVDDVAFRRRTPVPTPGKPPTFSEPKPAPFVVPIPQDEAAAMDPVETTFLNCCVILKARLAKLGVDRIRAAIRLGYITNGNHAEMCNLPDVALEGILSCAVAGVK